MTMRQYIGARYTTKVYENTVTPGSAEWQASVTYEPLTLVTYNNSSYLSKKTVPASVGNPPSNPDYWVVTGDYNGQIATLQAQINTNTSDISALANEDKMVIFPTTDPANVNNLAGSITAIKVKNHAFLIDLGISNVWHSVATKLQNFGIDTIDGVLITHYHGDHDGNDLSGNYDYLKNDFDWSNCVFYLPPDVPSFIDPSTYNTTTEAAIIATFPDNTIVKAPSIITTFYDFVFEVFNNTAADYSYYVSNNVSDYNEYSQIVRISNNGASLLNFADAGATAQTRQMSLNNFKATDIITAPHHGLETTCADGLPELLHCKYIYCSNTYRGNATTLRDPLITRSLEHGAQLLTNVDNYPSDVSGAFGNFATLGGCVNSTVNYSTYNYKKIYLKPSVGNDVYQDGSFDHPFSDVARTISACIGKINEIHILEDISTSLTFTPEQNKVIVDGEGHKLGIAVQDGGDVTLKNFETYGNYMMYCQNSSKLFILSGTINHSVSYDNSIGFVSPIVVRNANVGYSNSMICVNNAFYGGTGSVTP